MSKKSKLGQNLNFPETLVTQGNLQAFCNINKSVFESIPKGLTQVQQKNSISNLKKLNSVAVKRGHEVTCIEKVHAIYSGTITFYCTACKTSTTTSYNSYKTTKGNGALAGLLKQPEKKSS